MYALELAQVNPKLL
jgi:hypothetical protein